jgi:PAS domain S-box-containing protein
MIQDCSVPITPLSLSGTISKPASKQATNLERASFADGLRELNHHLLESSSDCILLLDEEGFALNLNRRARDLLEMREEHLKRRWHWTSLFQNLNLQKLPGSLAVKNNSTFEASSSTPSGCTKYWSFTFIALAGSGQFLLLARDMTGHVQAEKALRRSEEAFRKIFEENQIGILLANSQGQIFKANNALCAILGFNELELIGRDLQCFTASGNPSPQSLQRLLSGELRSFEYEAMLRTRNSNPVWTHVTTSILRHVENHSTCILQMIENIHARKQSETQVLAYQEKLQSLASELSLSEERERRRMATNLHDRIGQSLAFARLKLGAMAQAHPGAPINEVRELIEQTIIDTRSLTFELSPPVLYELGLVAALEWLTRKIQQEHSIPARFHDDSQPKPLDEDFRIVLFQASRELLVNVVKHASASHIHVLVRRDGDAMRIIVEDNGIGFDPRQLAAARHSPKSFGLFNIRERVEYLGGKLKIRSAPGQGTRITLIAPLKLTDLKNHGS